MHVRVGDCTEAATVLSQTKPGSQPGESSEGQAAGPDRPLRLPEVSSQCDSAALGGQGAGRLSPLLWLQEPDLASTIPPIVSPIVEPHTPSSAISTYPTLDQRVQDLEGMVGELQSELTRRREEVASLTEVCSMARWRARQATMLMAQMEHNWLSWSVGGPRGYQLHSQDRFGRRSLRRCPPHRVFRLGSKRPTFSIRCRSWRMFRW